jgi:hypothetical protein
VADAGQAVAYTFSTNPASSCSGRLRARSASRTSASHRSPSLLPEDLQPAGEVERELRNDVVRLRRTHRYGGTIGELAEAIRSGQPDGVLAVLHSGKSDVDLVQTSSVDRRVPPGLDGLRSDVQSAGRALTEAARATSQRR